MMLGLLVKLPFLCPVIINHQDAVNLRRIDGHVSWLCNSSSGRENLFSPQSAAESGQTSAKLYRWVRAPIDKECSVARLVLLFVLRLW